MPLSKSVLIVLKLLRVFWTTQTIDALIGDRKSGTFGKHDFKHLASYLRLIFNLNATY